MERARARVKEQLDTQKGKAADGLENVANIVRQSTQPLRDQRHDTTALYVEKAAEHMDRVSTSLRDRDVAELMLGAESFARQQPALFLGATFAAGFIAARFLKSSAEPVDRSRHEYERWRGGAAYEGDV
jgi:hypothetical protein